MGLTPLLSSLGIIFLAELEDKSQLMVISLCTKHRPRTVFLTSFLALLAIGGVSVFMGSTISHFLPMLWVKVGSGVAFTIFGFHTLLDEGQSFSNGKTGLLPAFSMMVLLELGDKTQLSTVALSAQFQSTLSVFLEVSLAFLLVTGVGVLVGTKIRKLPPKEHIKILSSLLFLLFGIVSLIIALTGITPL